MNVDVGDRFHVAETIELTDRIGRVHTRFLPGFTYPVTVHSQKEIQVLAAQGRVIKGPAPGGDGAAVSTRVRGNVIVKDAKK